MTNNNDRTRIVGSIAKTGKSIVKAKLYCILCLGLIVALVVGVMVVQLQPGAVIVNGGGGGGDPPPPLPPIPPSTESSVLNPIIPNPDTDGSILLYWGALDTSVFEEIYNVLIFVYYDVLRSKNGGSWITIEEEIYSTSDSLSYTDVVWSDGTYEYKIKSKAYIVGFYNFVIYTNVVSVVVSLPVDPVDPDPVYPTNPSISINNGAETTNSFTVTLTLYCDNADEMQIRLSEDIVLTWEDYSTTRELTLIEGYLQDDEFRIGVVFRNDEGTTDAEYGDIYDDITYVAPDDNGDGNGDEETDYTLMFVLIAVFVGLIGIAIFMKIRKKAKKKIKLKQS